MVITVVLNIPLMVVTVAIAIFQMRKLRFSEVE